jgi:glycosyltransferase involved in cell wall biosynthesis
MVSLCMIVKNEENVLAQCLESIISIADEIIIVDTGSNDDTIKIAKKYTKNVYHFDWIDDFSAARNYADSLAKEKYILRWDADWVLRDGDIEKIQALKKKNFYDVDMVNLTWIEQFEKSKTGKIYPLVTETLFFFYKRNKFHWQSSIHNELVANDLKFIAQTFTQLDIHVFHIKEEAKKNSRKQQTISILAAQISKKINTIID